MNYGQPQAPWRQLPEGLPMTPWYQNLVQGTQLPSWQGPSNLPLAGSQYWRGMNPSERLGYQGLAQTMGVYWPDMQQRMQQLWPSWTAPRQQLGRQAAWW